MRLTIAISLALVVLGDGSALMAASVWNTPVYNPDTKSYFELYTPADQTYIEEGGNIYGLSWTVAKTMAQKLTYKGVRGRLAVVNTREIHNFLKEKFHPTKPAWIGLRYWCKFKKLQWVTGEAFDRKKDFSAWGPMWDQNTTRNYVRLGQQSQAADCSAMFSGTLNYLGVHYWSMDEGFEWNANGYAKHFDALFVEFPTGKP